MRRLFVSKIALIVGALGMSGAAHAQDLDSASFTSQAQAESYLRQNPTGPRAKAAFLAIVEFQLARENPGFSRSDIARSVNIRTAGASAQSGQSAQSSTGSNQNDGGDLY